MYMCLLQGQYKDSSCTKLGHLELCLPHASCMCVSCQRGGTSMKILCKKACGPLTSGCQSLQTCLAFAFVAILSDHRHIWGWLLWGALRAWGKRACHSSTWIAHVSDVAYSDLGSMYPADQWHFRKPLHVMSTSHNQLSRPGHEQWWVTKSDVNTPAFGPNKSHSTPGPLEANRNGRVGQFFQAQPGYQVSLTRSMLTLRQNVLLLFWRHVSISPSIYTMIVACVSARVCLKGPKICNQ